MEECAQKLGWAYVKAHTDPTLLKKTSNCSCWFDERESSFSLLLDKNPEDESSNLY